MKVGLALAALAATAGVASGQRPSVVVILVDDLGAADVAYSARRLNGEAAFETPNLDALALGDGGVQFEKAYTHMICGPSRSALVTGRLAHGLGNPFAMIKGGGLDAKFRTIGHEFKLRGYSTHFVGKWGIDYPRPSDDVLKGGPSYHNFNAYESGQGPTERGFDTFYGLYSSGHNHFTKEVVYSGVVDWHSHNRTHKLDFPELDHEPEEYSTHLFTREAIRAIDSWSVEDPGFLHLSYTAPHDPLQAPDEYLAHPDCAKMRNWRRQTFCGMVKAVDRGVGQVVEALRRKGLHEHTIILFSTDNGGAPSVGGFNYPFKGQKATIYEGGVHNPAFIHLPAGLGAARSALYSEVIHIADYAPTLLGLVDRAAGHLGNLGKYRELGEIDGIDHSAALARSIAGEIVPAPVGPLRTATVLEFNAFMLHAAYLEGDWKLTLGNAGRPDTFKEPTGRFYDADARPQFIVEEVVCDIVEGHDVNNFVYGWAFRFLVDRVFSASTGAEDQAMMMDMVETVEFGDTVAITEANLPVADWSKFDFGKVQLYNLAEDPLETTNLALQHRDLVEAMAGRLREAVRADPGHNLSVQKQFVFFIKDLTRAIVAILVVGALLLVALLTCVCSRRRQGKRLKAE